MAIDPRVSRPPMNTGTPSQIEGPTPAGEQSSRAASQRYRIFVYHHTHWDREWWATYQDFRIRLVELIDELLETLETDPEFRCFLLDGQTIVLKDYLEIRPENRERLVGYLNDGRIQCGPWHILPDEFLVSGEAHIRNLWLGARTAQQLGFRNLDVGYIPDTFGHISQMPQILHGFGVETAMVWRGVVEGQEPLKQDFWWEAPDGSRVLAHWLPEGYYQLPFLHLDNPQRPFEDKLGRIQQLIDVLSSRATADCLLMPYGGDHLLIDRRLPRLLREVNQSLGECGEFVWATTSEYFAALRERGPALSVLRGELRAAGEETAHLLPGVLSSRIYLKQLNFQGQLWLERYAEPFSALAWRYGRRYDAGLLWAAWELLVQNHPHDSICGCSIDQVHREMLPRFDQSRQIAEIITEKSAQYINSRIATDGLEPEALPLVVHNPLPWTRSQTAAVLVDRAAGISPRTHLLRDPEGKPLPFQVRDVDSIRPMTDAWRYSELRFTANEVPGLGYQLFSVVPRETPLRARQMLFSALQPVASFKGNEAVSDLLVGDGVLENRYLRVEVDRNDGALRILDKRSGLRYSGLNAFEDGGDAGDTYNYAAPLCDSVLLSTEGAQVHVSLAEAGYVSATLRVDLSWPLPAALAEDRLSRGADYRELRISSFVTLHAEASRVEVRTEVENQIADHRLRALFPLGAAAAVSDAEGHFDVVRRPVARGEQGHGWPEPAVFNLPQQGYVSVAAAGRGLTIANKGLPEFEVLDDGEGTLALTLLRAVGWLSRDDLLSRTGGAGPQTPTPDAQCPGRQVLEYAIIPHAGDWLAARAYRTAHDYLAPLYGTVAARQAGDLPRRDGLLELSGDHTLLLSACKRAERSEALILRFWNVAKAPTTARLALRERPVAVRRVNLAEEPLDAGELAVDADGSLLFSAGPAEIITLEIRF